MSDLWYVQDRADAIDVVQRYMNYADRRKWESMVSLFAEVVYVDYSSMRPGEVAAKQDRAALINFWRERFAPIKATQHHLGSLVADVEGDEATVYASGIAAHFKRPPDGEGMLLWQVGVAYDWRLVRHGDSWKIAAVTANKLWERSERQ